jgi:hypothetical protein
MNAAAQVENDVHWLTKAAIGALGGIALTLLKLIDAKFYVGATSSIEVQAAYFTYLAYIALGSLAAVFISDHDLPPRKIKRSAFVLGLLAPSVLLAIVSQPVRVSAPQRDAAIPKISAFPFAAAHAAEPGLKALPPLPLSPLKPMGPVEPFKPGELGAKVELKMLPKSALQPTFLEAFWAAVGRKDLEQKYVFVVGSTQDKGKALEAAALTNEMLTPMGGLKTSIIQIEGKPDYYVTVGGFLDQRNALKVKADSNAIAAKFLAVEYATNKVAAEDRSRIAVLLADAPVVPTNALWKP